MARITIDTDLFADTKFIRFMFDTNPEEAIGEWVLLLFKASKFYLSHGYIPFSELNEDDFSTSLFEFGLVTKGEFGYILYKQDEQFSWLRSKVENGRKGGIARASGTKQHLSESSEFKPITITSSITKEKENIIKEKEPKPTPIGHSSENKFSSEFEEIKNLYPKRKGHLNLAGARKAVVKLLTRGESFEALKSAARAYKEDCSKSGRTGTEFVLQMSTFFGKNEIWREYLNVKKKSGFTAEELGITSTYQP